MIEIIFKRTKYNYRASIVIPETIVYVGIGQSENEALGAAIKQAGEKLKFKFTYPGDEDYPKGGDDGRE